MNRILVLIVAAVVWGGFLGAGILSAEKPAGSIQGQVQTREGAPLPRASLVFHGETGVRRVVTASDDGSYRADKLPIDTYRILARFRGYDGQWVEPEITLSENQEIKDVTFALVKRDPAMKFAASQHVFLPKDKLHFGTRGSLVEEAVISLSRLDMGPVLATRGNLSSITDWEGDTPLPPAIPPSAVSLMASWSVAIPAGALDEEDWFHKTVAVPAQPEGTYLLTLEAAGVGESTPRSDKKTLRHAYWFSVTRLALVTKRSPTQVLVFAADFETHEPVEGATLALYTVYPGNLVTTGMTDANGIWRADFDSEVVVTVVGRMGASFAHVASYRSTRDRCEVYTYTDRPIYRPGHKVQFKGIVRNLEGAEARLSDDRSVKVLVKDPEGEKVYTAVLPMSDMGTYAGEFTLPQEARMGEYSLQSKLGDRQYDTSLKVAAYRKPEFKLQVSPAAPRVLAGKETKVAINATYYFGAPVAGAKVHYSVFALTEYVGWTLEDLFYRGYEEGEDDIQGGEVVSEGDAITDEAGQLIIPILTNPIAAAPPRVQAYDQRYVIEIESQDESRRLVKGKGSFLVVRGDFRISAQVSSYLVEEGKPVTATISATDYEGRPVATSIKVVLLREVTVPGQGDVSSTTRYVEVHRMEVRTDAQGRAQMALEGPEPGSYLVEAEARDSGGRQIGDEAWFWSSAEGVAASNNWTSLGVTFDKKTYKPGDVAKVMISSPLPDRTILLTIEGHKLHGARTVRLKGASAVIDLPIEQAYQPNVYVCAAIVEGKELLSTERSLNVSPSDRFLDVAIAPSKPRYLPGEDAVIRITTTGVNGKPLPAEVSLGVVDEAIYALAPDRTPDIRKTFLGPRSSAITTSHSFQEEYSGGPGKDLPEVRVRKHFEDTAAWFPAIRTDGAGMAEVRFKLPDNLTTWICTARGVTRDTFVGAVTGNFLASKDLLVRLATPRFFTQGDQLLLAGLTHNYTDSTLDVAIRLDPGILKISGPLSRDERLGPGKASRIDWPAGVPVAGTASLIMTARANGDSDGLQLDVPVLAHGIPVAKAFAGEARGGATAVHFEVPTNAVPQSLRFNLDLVGSPRAALASGLAYLARYPYWCSEQTSSRIIPLAAALPLFANHRRKSESRGVIKDATRKLLALQHGDGGWGWWETGDSEVETSAYALTALAAARDSGEPVPTRAGDQAAKWLIKTLPTIKKDTPRRYVIERGTGAVTVAVGLLGLARWGEAPAGIVDGLWARRADLTPYGRAVFAETLGRLRDRRADRALAELDKQAKISETIAHWDAGGGPFSWGNSDVEATAHALTAHVLRDADKPIVAKAERWLETTRQREKWLSTKDTAAALEAIALVARAWQDRQGTPFNATITLDGAPVASATIDPRKAEAPLQVALAGLSAGSHRLKIGVGGSLSAPVPDAQGAQVSKESSVMYQATLRYIERQDPIAALPGKAFEVRRDYYFIPKTLAAEARSRTLPELFSEKFFPRLSPVRGPVQSGDRVVVRVQVKATEDVRFVLLEDPLPSGAEVQEDADGEPWSYWWSHRDVRDDKVAFFVTTLTKGDHAFYYLIRPEIPGTFKVLPTTIEAMYAPDVRARSAEGRLEVKP